MRQPAAPAGRAWSRFGWRDFLLVQSRSRAPRDRHLAVLRPAPVRARSGTVTGLDLHAGAMGAARTGPAPLLRWCTANSGSTLTTSRADPHLRAGRGARDHPALRGQPLTLRHSFACFRLALWDERSDRWSAPEAALPAPAGGPDRTCSPARRWCLGRCAPPRQVTFGTHSREVLGPLVPACTYRSRSRRRRSPPVVRPTAELHRHAAMSATVPAPRRLPALPGTSKRL